MKVYCIEGSARMRKRMSWASLLMVITLLLISLAACLLTGCGEQETELQPGESAYNVYYLNPSMTRMVPQEYRTKTTDTELLVQELMERFMQVPANLDCQEALSDKVVYQGYRQQDMMLYLYFDNNYTSMKADREILCRAALVKTLTQIPGIDYINIYSADQPLLDANGSPVGMLSASDFIDSFSDVNAFEHTEIILYFTDASGEKLFPEKREVVHNINTSVAKVILEELISGPESGLSPTLDPATKLLSVSVNENVCYVNFDDSFLKNSLEVKEYIPIYSIVNSLSDLLSVSRVQITVNGSQDIMFRDVLSLDTLFERNLDYIGGNEN